MKSSSQNFNATNKKLMETQKQLHDSLALSIITEELMAEQKTEREEPQVMDQQMADQFD